MTGNCMFCVQRGVQNGRLIKSAAKKTEGAEKRTHDLNVVADRPLTTYLRRDRAVISQQCSSLFSKRRP